MTVQQPQQQPKQNKILFCGNFVKDNIIHFKKSTNETISQTCSLGGSVTFGSLAFAHYIADLSNNNKNSSDESSLFKVEIISNVDGSKLTRSESQLIHDKIVASKKKQKFEAQAPCAIQLPNSLECQVHSTDDHGSVEEEQEPYLTSYDLLYNDENTLTNERTLILSCQGPTMNDAHWLSSQCISSGGMEEDIHSSSLPLALFFVPVAAEFDEHAVCHVMDQMSQKYQSQLRHKMTVDDGFCMPRFPLVCCDVQGFLRCFSSHHHNDNNNQDNIKRTLETNVQTHPSCLMRQKLERLGKHVFLLKADASEANAVLRDDSSSEQELKPIECAKRLHKLFDFPVICITMGPQGCLVSCKQNKKNGKINISHNSNNNNRDKNEQHIVYRYIPAYKPKCTVDETGCGDTFLSCLMAEILISSSTNSSSTHHHHHSPDEHDDTTAEHNAPTYLDTEHLFEAVKMATAATSFVVECMGPQGFVSRSTALSRVQHGETIPLCIELE